MGSIQVHMRLKVCVKVLSFLSSNWSLPTSLYTYETLCLGSLLSDLGISALENQS